MDFTEIIGYIVSVLTAVGGWIVGRHARRKTAISNLMETIGELSKQVSEYQSRIIDLQKEVLEVRKENADLKDGQSRMVREIKRLQEENEVLKKLITQKSK